MKNADELIMLLGEPMDSKTVIDTLDSLELPQSSIDEHSYEDREVVVYGQETVGIDFVFEENILSQNGIPVLDNISFYKNYNEIVTNGLTMHVTYQNIIQKLKQKPLYMNKFLPTSRIWVFSREDGIKYFFSADFKDDALADLKSIVIGILDDKISPAWITLKDIE